MLTKKLSISKMENNCEEVASLLKAMAHPQRLMVLGHLAQSPKTVSELQELCTISQSQLSQFLGRMRLEGLVRCERQGKYQYYSPADHRVVKLIAAIHSIYCQ